MARKTIEQYQRAAERLSNRAPQLKKLVKRKRLTPAEKRQISYYENVARIMRERVDERPEKFRDYKFPGEKIIPDKIYKQQARALAKYTKHPEKFVEYSKKKKLSGAEKSSIRKKMNLLRHTENVYALTPQQARKLPKEATIGQGIYAIKLRNTGPKTKITRVQDNKMYVTSSGRKWVYEVTGTKQEALAAAAESAFNSGALFVYFWTVHGRVGEASGNIEAFLYALKSRYMQYLSANMSADPRQSTDWLLGIAYTKDKGEREKYLGG